MQQIYQGPFTNETTRDIRSELVSVSRNACERCYKRRKRCNFDDSSQQSCIPCGKDGLLCIKRGKKRMGRRPKAQIFPSESGNFSVFGLQFDTHDANSEVDESTTMRIQSEPVKTYSELRSSFPKSLPPLLSRTLTSLDRKDEKLFHYLATTKGFLDLHAPFLIGKSFQDDFQRTVICLMNISHDILLNGYRAILYLMESQKEQPIDTKALDVSLGTGSLRALSLLSVSAAALEDFAVLMMLGQIMLAYNTLLWLDTTRVIARSTLMAVKHHYSDLYKRQEYDSVIITPVFIDIVDCILRREMPVLRPPESDRIIIDRCCGLLTPLLPLLYDLCQCSYRVKLDSIFEAFRSLDDPYEDIENRIKTWTPRFPDNFSSKYSQQEQRIMLATSKTYTLTALLVIHRLRYPVGMEDVYGLMLAEKILDEIAPLSTLQLEEASGLNLDFPLLVASIELPTRGMLISTTFEPFRYCKHQLKSCRDFVQLVKAAQADGFQGLWFDLIDVGYVGDILP
jgi:hypothetical protein